MRALWIQNSTIQLCTLGTPPLSNALFTVSGVKFYTQKKYPYSLIRSNNWKHRWCAKQTRVVTLIAREWKKLMVWKEKVNTTYPVLKHPFIIFKRWLNCIFHSRRLAAHASYENIETPLSAVRNQNKAKERAVYTRMECKRQCYFKK